MVQFTTFMQEIFDFTICVELVFFYKTCSSRRQGSPMIFVYTCLADVSADSWHFTSAENVRAHCTTILNGKNDHISISFTIFVQFFENSSTVLVSNFVTEKWLHLRLIIDECENIRTSLDAGTCSLSGGLLVGVFLDFQVHSRASKKCIQGRKTRFRVCEMFL